MVHQPVQCLEIVQITQIHQTEIEFRLLIDFHGHAADRSPQHAATRILHIVDGAAGDDGQSASAVRVLNPVGDQGLDKRDETGCRSLPCRVFRILTAEVVDRLQVRGFRPVVQHMELISLHCVFGDRVHLVLGFEARRPS